MFFRLIIMLAASAGGTFAAVPDGYVSYWKFDNDLTDENGMNGGSFAGGPETYTDGVNGGAVVVSGTTYVDAGNDASLDFDSCFSIGGWVLVRTRGGYHKMVNKSTWNTGFYIQQGGGYPTYWDFYMRGGGEVLDTISVMDQYDTWFHYMGVYDGAAMYLYRDGELIDSAASGPMTPSTATLKFGSMNGWLDEMIYYDRALSGAEVAELMAATRDTTPPAVLDLVVEQVPGYSALVTFTTDQTAYATVEYTRDSVIAQYDHHDAGTEHSTIINGLGVANTWYYRVHAVNLLGYASTTAWETLHVALNAPDQKFSLQDGSASTRPYELDLTWPESVGDAEVCLYPDDKLAAVTMTIDDNSAIWENHEMWTAWGDTFDMKFTWFVNTAGIDQGSANAGTWGDWRYLYSLGHAVQSHSHTHGSTTLHTSGELNWMEDYGKCRAWVEEQIPGNQCITTAYPGGSFANSPDTAMNYYIAARGTYAIPNGPGRFNYGDTRCSSSWNTDHVLSVLNRTTTVYGTNYRRGWACFIVHSVQDESRPDFRSFLSLLDDHRDSLWVGTYPALMKYNQSFNTHDLDVTAVTDSMISFALTDSMMDTVYNEPLTVKVRIGNDWDTCIAMQGANPVDVSVVEHDGNTFALVKAVPDRGEVVLSTDGKTSGMRSIERGVRSSGFTRYYSLSGRMLPEGQALKAGVYLRYENGELVKKINLK